MKKKLGVFGIVMIATYLSFSINYDNLEKGEMDIANLISMSSANAEYTNGGGASGVFGEAVWHTNTHTYTIGGGVVPGSYSYSSSYSQWECDGWWGWCY